MHDGLGQELTGLALSARALANRAARERDAIAGELDQLAAMYAPPSGCLILAQSDAGPIGCGAIRLLRGDACEMKRLYLRPQARYARMVLDTLVDMRAARKLYSSLGFRETAPYYDNPLRGVVYMQLDLSSR